MADLTRLSVNFSAEWQSKTVTTGPPKWIPHEEWRLVVFLHAPAPIRLWSLFVPTDTSSGVSFTRMQ